MITCTTRYLSVIFDYSFLLSLEITCASMTHLENYANQLIATCRLVKRKKTTNGTLLPIVLIYYIFNWGKLFSDS